MIINRLQVNSLPNLNSFDKRSQYNVISHPCLVKMVTLSLTHSQRTWHTKSDSEDLWPFRHLIRVTWHDQHFRSILWLRIHQWKWIGIVSKVKSQKSKVKSQKSSVKCQMTNVKYCISNFKCIIIPIWTIAKRLETCDIWDMDSNSDNWRKKTLKGKRQINWKW